MQGQWQNVIFKVVGWLTAEILLTLLNLDNIADFSEFVFRQDAITTNRSHTGTVTLTTVLSCPWIAGLAFIADPVAPQLSLTVE